VQADHPAVIGLEDSVELGLEGPIGLPAVAAVLGRTASLPRAMPATVLLPGVVHVTSSRHSWLMVSLSASLKAWYPRRTTSALVIVSCMVLSPRVRLY
jgi:hypothetical protein